MNTHILRGICVLIICASGSFANAQTPSPNTARPSVTPHATDCSQMGCAQPPEKITADTLPPITEQPLAISGVVDCSKMECALPQEQISAITLATHLYQTEDMPKVLKFNLQVTKRDATVKVTIFPDDVGDIPSFSVPGDHMAVTYIFDASGTVLKKKSFNR